MAMSEVMEQVAIYFAGTSISALFICWLVKSWTEKRIEKSIEHAYAKQLADYQAVIDEKLAAQQENREIRQRAALIAELLSAWIVKPVPNRDELNRLSFEAFLWLPQDIAVDLSNTLAHSPGSRNIRELIVMVRKHLLGPGDSLPARDVIVFPESISMIQPQSPAPPATPSAGP
jgi:hypothetical protein